MEKPIAINPEDDKSESVLMLKPRKNIAPSLFIGIAVFLLLAWYLSFNTSYPYYHCWDMDYVTTLDSVLIQSDMLPDQNCHPSFGMYLILKFSEKAAHNFNVISAITLDELSTCLNPLSAMAELTDFVRLHSPFLALGIVVFLVLALRNIFAIRWWYFLLFLGVLGIQGSLGYHSSLVRSELYSVFFWSVSLFVMSIAAKIRDGIPRVIVLMLTGVLLGLTFFTKIQSFFYVVIVPFFFIQLVLLFEEDDKIECSAITNKRVITTVLVSVINVLAFVILGIKSYRTAIPAGIPTWAESFGIQPITVVFFLGFFSLFALQLFLILTKKTGSNVFRLSSYLGFIALGFLLSFLLYFLLYTDPGISVQQILIHFKLSLLREPKLLRNPETSDYLPNLLKFLYTNTFMVVLVLGLNLFLFIGRQLNFIKIRRSQVLFCLAGALICFLNVAFVTRNDIRDTLWKETVFIFLILFYIGIVLSKAVCYRKHLEKVFAILLVLIFFVTFFYSQNMRKRIDAEWNQYGWRSDKWFTRVYDGNQRKYWSLMRNTYNQSTAWVANSQAVDYKRIRRTAEYVFNNQQITHCNIGIAFNGFSVWRADYNYKIVKVPKALQGSMVVDSGSAKLLERRTYREENVKKYREEVDKYQKYSTSGQMSVLTRSDLRIYLFAHPNDVSALLSEKIVTTPYRITVSNKNETIELEGLEIKEHCGISFDKLVDKYFFVIRK